MLTVIIVNWNVRDLLAQCLVSLRQHPPADGNMQIVVVDNASADDSVAILRRDFPEVVLIANSQNRGFTGGNNDGLRWLRAHGEAGSDVLLLNPDTKVHAGALDSLIELMRAQPDVGVTGPRMIYGDGSPQSTARAFPTLVTAMFESTWLQRFAPQSLLDRYYARHAGNAAPSDVDWLVGAALLIRRKALDAVGEFDEARFFMYSEELDLCKRIKEAGWRVVYEARATITHYEGRSSGQVSGNRMRWFNLSKARYFRKHHGKMQAAVLRCWLAGQFAWQWLLERAKALLGNQPAMRHERARAYGSVIVALLRE
jgi:hypothetical protein